jgi:hypothetical protein
VAQNRWEPQGLAGLGHMQVAATDGRCAHPDPHLTTIGFGQVERLDHER